MDRLFIFTLPMIVTFFVAFFSIFVNSGSTSEPFFLRLSRGASDESGFQKEPAYSIITRQLGYLSGEGALFGVYFHGNRNKKNVALTFDADMTRGMLGMLRDGAVQSFYDLKLISALRQTETPATLFLSGLWIEKYPNVTEELARDPLFELGSHSYAHKAYATPCYSLEPLEENEKVADLGASQMLLQKYTGKTTTLFRFPGGCSAPSDIVLLKMAGVRAIAWDVVADDGFNGDEISIINKVVAQVKNGSIIVMHMNGFPNEPVDHLAVPKIIETLRNKGYTFVKVSELLGFSQ